MDVISKPVSYPPTKDALVAEYLPISHHCCCNQGLANFLLCWTITHWNNWDHTSFCSYSYESIWTI